MLLLHQIQGIVGGIHWGLGQGSGMVFGGYLFDFLGGEDTFLVGAVVSALSLLFTTWQCRRWSTIAAGQETQPGIKRDASSDNRDPNAEELRLLEGDTRAVSEEEHCRG